MKGTRNTLKPKVTVLMPVYNGEEYLSEAIDSILKQTYTDFELLIVDDGSNDTSVDIIKSYKDGRIRVVNNERNIKLVATLNRGLEIAQGEYIARMDCDDISLPDRLEKQVSLMDRCKEIGICGSWIEIFGEGNWINRYPRDNDSIKCGLLFETQLAHPAVMIRKNDFVKNQLFYDPEFKHAEDYELWVRASRKLKITNIESVLVRYRLHSQQISSIKQNEQLETVRKIRFKQIRNLGILPSKEEMDIHESLCKRKFIHTYEFIENVQAWLRKLKEANAELHYFPEPIFSHMLSQLWFDICYSAEKKGLDGSKVFWKSPLSRQAKALNIIRYFMKFAWKNVMRRGDRCVLML